MNMTRKEFWQMIARTRLVRLLPALIASVALLAAAPLSAQAQNYPTKNITMIVPFAAGGPTDTVARLLGQSMGKTLGQTIVVENVGGAGGTLGAARAAKAAPDGYTIFLHHIGHATSATLYRKLPYDTVGDFAPIGLVTDVPMTLVAKAGTPANTLAELVDYLKKNKDKVSYANAGVGAASHLCGMLFMSAIQTELTTVAYRGTGPAMNDLLGGQVDVMCDQTTNTTSQIKAGKIKVYAVTSPTRVPSLPDVPTSTEAGLPALQVAVWHGLYAPKGTPKPVVDRLVAAVQTALEDPLIKDRFAELGTEPVAKDRATPEALAAHLKAEIAKWGPIIKNAGIYAD
jgi:tripartite-type tricarboxylate transporter receptor subunit TctC